MVLTAVMVRAFHVLVLLAKHIKKDVVALGL